MKRLTYSEVTQKFLEEATEKNRFYWRYQDSQFNGLIPVGHESCERVYEGEAPEYIEEGCSCYDNPYQLLDYMVNDISMDTNTNDVVLFVGRHMGYGLDNEDIVMVEEEGDVRFSMSAKDFYKFCKNADLYWNGKNIKQLYHKLFD